MVIVNMVVQMVWLASLLVMLGGSAQAQSNARGESGWKPLKADLSRGQLFAIYASEMAKQSKGQVEPFALPAGFTFPRDARFDTNGAERRDTIFGVDISHYEPDFPLGDLKRQNVAFVYMKATQGSNYKDDTFASNWKTAASLPEDKRIPRGAYHFLSSARNETGKAQADSFVDYVNLHGGFQPGDLPPAMDLEWDKACQTCRDRWRDRTSEEIVNTSVDFLNRVKERAGRTPMIYTNKSFLNDVGIIRPDLVKRLTGGFKVWIFDLDGRDRQIELPNPQNNLPHVLWQFSFTGRLTSSYERNFDTNVFKGTVEEFKTKFTGSD